MFCRNCGKEIADLAAICVHCGVPTLHVPMNYDPQAKNRLAFVLLGVFLGPLGIHNFYAGYTGKGIAQLLITIFAGWLIIPLAAVWIWVIVEICTIEKDIEGRRMT